MISKTDRLLFSEDFVTQGIEALCEGFDDHAIESIKQALQIVKEVESITPDMPRGADVAVILKSLGLDPQTIIAALLSDLRLDDGLDYQQQFGQEVAVLLASIRRLNSFNEYSPKVLETPEQTEILRRMLLAMVDDMRAVIIKLAYRIQRLRDIPTESYEIRQFIAQETLDIYSPLANRLGIAQLKWELEDLAFRYLQPQIYKQISKSLAESRTSRQDYIERFIQQLEKKLEGENLHVVIDGRPKHIYSIWCKMQRKQAELEDLYDLHAVRVITEKISTCYEILSLVHNQWQYIPSEFDDYIANPKENGYQSLHTVVSGPEDILVEVQIRTQDMHRFAELGVAAHWRYKEAGEYDTAVEKSIRSIRALLDNRDSENLLTNFKTELYSDRIFVLTPQGQLKDLIKGSTPLDFAYAVHTEVGHRCRGAKVNGRIVPLTYTLLSGETVEILTAKEGKPNQSWLDTHLGYLKSSHGISKVKAWFKQQDHEKNLRDGKALLERERQRLGLDSELAELLTELMQYFRLNREEDVLIKIGRGDIRPVQLARALNLKLECETPAIADIQSTNELSSKKTEQPVKVVAPGLGDIETFLARCCNPVPGNPIVGYITRTRGVTVHRQGCQNMQRLSKHHQARVMEVNWSDGTLGFSVTISIQADDRPALLSDITQAISNSRADILGFNTRNDPVDSLVKMEIQLEIRDAAHLVTILDKIAQLDNVVDVRRKR